MSPIRFPFLGAGLIAMATGLELGSTSTSARSRPQQDAPATGVELPPGPMADLLARLQESHFEPVAPPPIWPEWNAVHGTDSEWDHEPAWRAWVELLRAEERGDARGRAMRCARLALLAVAQGRGDDAWQHLLAAGADPIVTAVLPALLPGVPLEQLGNTGALPAGVLLRPVIPPPALDAHGQPLLSSPQTMKYHGLRIAGTRATLVVQLEGDGVQVDVVHTAGPPVQVRVLPPLPMDVEVDILYSDWEKVAQEQRAVTLTLDAAEERHTLWLRFRYGTSAMPAIALAQRRSGRATPAIEIVVPPSLANEPRLARFAEALAELFERPCLLRSRDQEPPPRLVEPIAMHFAEGEDWMRRLVALVAMVEASVRRR